MVNERSKANLVQNSASSPIEARELSRKGGIRSGEVRRAKRDLRISLKWMQGLPLSRKDQKKVNDMLGSKEKLSQVDAVAFALLDKARKGEAPHLRLFSELTGVLKEDSDTQTINISYNVPGTITDEMQTVTAKLRSKRKSRTDDEPNE